MLFPANYNGSCAHETIHNNEALMGHGQMLHDTIINAKCKRKERKALSVHAIVSHYSCIEEQDPAQSGQPIAAGEQN